MPKPDTLEPEREQDQRADSPGDTGESARARADTHRAHR